MQAKDEATCQDQMIPVGDDEETPAKVEQRLIMHAFIPESQADTRPRHVDGSLRLPHVDDRLCRRPGQRVALPISVLQGGMRWKCEVAEQNGGGAFLVAYAFFWVTAAVPIFVLEVAVGQLLQRGGIQVWMVCPLFRGVGLANLTITFICICYYCIIVSWAVFYMIGESRVEDCGDALQRRSRRCPRRSRGTRATSGGTTTAVW